MPKNKGLQKFSTIINNFLKWIKCGNNNPLLKSLQIVENIKMKRCNKHLINMKKGFILKDYFNFQQFSTIVENTLIPVVNKEWKNESEM